MHGVLNVKIRPNFKPPKIDLGIFQIEKPDILHERTGTLFTKTEVSALQIKVTPNLRGCPSEKSSYARRLQGNHHKLYIKRKVIKCTIQ